jgi:hypothetical protein
MRNLIFKHTGNSTAGRSIGQENPYLQGAGRALPLPLMFSAAHSAYLLPL